QREHYADARRVTLNIVTISLSLMGVYLLIVRTPLIIDAGVILLLVGSIQLFQTIAFIVIDREVKGAEVE
ncbi:MAG: hypothetical protein RSF83_03930, partial [Hungatella sp.]